MLYHTSLPRMCNNEIGLIPYETSMVSDTSKGDFYYFEQFYYFSRTPGRHLMFSCVKRLG